MIHLAKDLPIAIKLWARFSKYAQSLNFSEEIVWREFLDANGDMVTRIKLIKAFDNWLVNIATEDEKIIYYAAFGRGDEPQPRPTAPENAVEDNDEGTSGYDAEIK